MHAASYALLDDTALAVEMSSGMSYLQDCIGFGPTIARPPDAQILPDQLADVAAFEVSLVSWNLDGTDEVPIRTRKFSGYFIVLIHYRARNFSTTC